LMCSLLTNSIYLFPIFQTLEYVSEEYGGRVELAKAYHKGLTNSLSKNFGGSGLISSIQQCNDFFFLGTNQISMERVGNKVFSFFFFFFLLFLI